MPESLRSKSERSKLPSEAKAELFVEVDAERVEAEYEIGAETEALTAFALDFFFLTDGQAAKNETQPFSLEALLSVPSCLLSSL